VNPVLREGELFGDVRSDWARPCSVFRMSNQSRHSFRTVRTNRSAMGRAAGHVHAAATDFNEEQHIQPLEPDGIDAKEVDGNHAVSLALEELPATTYRAACRPDRAGAFATPFHRRRRHDQAKALQFTYDVLIPPVRVFTRQANDQGSNCTADRNVARTSTDSPPNAGASPEAWSA
jgi:hypothetical protein